MATILIIEDDINLAEMIKDKLENKGYNPILAYTVRDAFNIFSKIKPDVITLDIYLPDRNGFELLKMLKKDKNKSSIPIIVVTSDDTLEKHCRDYKVDGFIRKPINFKKLEEMIELATLRRPK